jgi:outer membrane lipoprotein carrier protein
LSDIELRYNQLATLKIDFEQTLTLAGQSRFQERGTLFLRRPQMMRWEYIKPAGKLLVGDGDLLYYYNPMSNQVRTVKPMETGDLRAPLAFLLGRLNFRRQFKELRLEPINGRSVLVGEGRTGKEAYTRVEFTYDPSSYSLQHLRVLGQDESVTTFEFSGEVVNPRLDPALFVFNPPPGAEWVDQAPAAEAG